MEHCIECNQELEIRLNAFVCTYPSCPLKGLLQVGMENVDEEERPKLEMRPIEKTGYAGLDTRVRGHDGSNLPVYYGSGGFRGDETLHSTDQHKLDKELDRILEKPKRWKPEEMDKYWYVSDWMEVRYSNWRDTYVDNLKFDAKNCNQTREEAELMRDKIKNLLNA